MHSNVLLKTGLSVSIALNIMLLIQINKEKRFSESMINDLNRAELIALYYIKETNKNKRQIKEEITMMKFASNRTKIFAASAAVLTVATVISAIRDNHEVAALIEDAATKTEEVAATASEAVADAVEDAADAVESVVEA